MSPLAVDRQHRFAVELHTQPDRSGTPVHYEDITADMNDLVEHLFVEAVLSEQLPPDPTGLIIDVTPVWLEKPYLAAIRVTIESPVGGSRHSVHREFHSGRWLQRLPATIQQLRHDKLLGEDQTAYAFLLAVVNSAAAPTLADLELLPLQPPPMEPRTLSDMGVMRLGDGSLESDRPVLVNDRMVDEILRYTEQSAEKEMGGAVLGTLARLPEPLPGTTTRLVTVLTSCVIDDRHRGEVAEFHFSPEALAEADQMAQLRGLGESVITVFHTHGWGTACGNCNENKDCPLPECTQVSTQDYQLLECLFPGKATTMPIAGRKLGAAGRRPVLEIHAYRGGRMRPIRWQRYHD